MRAPDPWIQGMDPTPWVSTPRKPRHTRARAFTVTHIALIKVLNTTPQDLTPWIPGSGDTSGGAEEEGESWGHGIQYLGLSI